MYRSCQNGAMLNMDEIIYYLDEIKFVVSSGSGFGSTNELTSLGLIGIKDTQ